MVVDLYHWFLGKHQGKREEVWLGALVGFGWVE